MQPLTLELQHAMELPPATFKRLVADHQVAVVKTRDLAVEQFVSLMTRLGTPVHHMLEQFCLPGQRAVLKISNLYRDGKAQGVHEGGAYWHTDMSYKTHNKVLTALWAVQVPSQGGDTEFIDCAAGLDLVRGAHGLSASLRKLDLNTAQVHHAFGNRDALRNSAALSQALNARQASALESHVTHPLVTVHPLNARPSLYAVGGTAMGLAGKTRAESLELLDELFDFLQTHAPRYRHRYEVGDLVIWDNLSTLHRGPEVPASEDTHDCRMLYRMNVDYLQEIPA